MRSIHRSSGRRLDHSAIPGRTFKSLLLLTFAACLLSVASSAQSTADEYQLKAAFLFHFTQYVEWPAEATGEDNSPFLICIVGEDPFQNSLEDAIKGKLVVGKAAKIRHIRQVEDGQKCHLIFLGNNESGRVSQLPESLKHAPVLTVGESADFLKNGGIIRFCMEGNKVRFEVSQEAAQGANLKISSRLLLLAKSVVARKSER